MGKNKKMNQKIRQEIVKTNTDAATGEVLGQTKQVRHFDAKFNRVRGYLWWNQKGGAKSFFDIPFPKDMSMIDRGRLATLSKYIWGDTNCLGYRGHGGFSPYSVEQVAKLIEVNSEQAERFLVRMKKMGIIKPIFVTFGERCETQYYINPLYYFSNRYLSANLYALFHEELEAYLPDWVKEEFAKGVPGEKARQVN